MVDSDIFHAPLGPVGGHTRALVSEGRSGSRFNCWIPRIVRAHQAGPCGGRTERKLHDSHLLAFLRQLLAVSTLSLSLMLIFILTITPCLLES